MIRPTSLLSLALAFALGLTASAQSRKAPSAFELLIPTPQLTHISNDAPFLLKTNATIGYTDKAVRPKAKLLAQQLSKITGQKYSVVKSKRADILLVAADATEFLAFGV